ncbi:hypothetical protein GCM10022247_35050 [Allokutzneria multivorans]|uniref:Uncharacterized protein n=1 Tax=Allokutzneria multivorans TaxID=1142134 RepID=A0ABP7SCL2_9PSEU
MEIPEKVAHRRRFAAALELMERSGLAARAREARARGQRRSHRFRCGVQRKRPTPWRWSRSGPCTTSDPAAPGAAGKPDVVVRRSSTR